MKSKKLYKAIAKQHGVSVSEVKHDIEKAIGEAYKNPNEAALAVTRKDAVPTVEEFVEYSIKMVMHDLLEKGTDLQNLD